MNLKSKKKIAILSTVILFLVCIMSVVAVSFFKKSKPVVNENDDQVETKYDSKNIVSWKFKKELHDNAYEKLTQAEVAVEEFEGMDKEELYNVIINGTGYSMDDYSYCVDRNCVSERYVNLPVSWINQYPELPTGCEITSLTTVLNYMGYSVSKTTMADNYLEKCDPMKGDFWEYFWGNPRDAKSFGCYASPIARAANAFLASQGSKAVAYNYSNSNFEVFLQELEKGNPVIIWTTIGYGPAKVTFSWHIDGVYREWIVPEHCVVLTGYNMDAGTVTISDPIYGIIERNMDLVADRYLQLCSQAVVVKENEEQPTTEAATQKATQSTTTTTQKATQSTTTTTQKATQSTTATTQNATSNTQNSQATESTSVNKTEGGAAQKNGSTNSTAAATQKTAP